MRKLISLAFLVTTLFLISCGGDESDPKVIANTKLLAGSSGHSKSWVMTKFELTDDTGTDDIFGLVPVCITDNVFTFSNSDNQEFVQVEGATKCDVANPTIVESGTWYLTSNGSSVTVIVFFDDVGNQDSAFFAYFPYPWTVNKLTSSTLVIEYEDVDDDVTYTITFVPA